MSIFAVELQQKEGSKLAGKQEYAKLVARDLYNFMYDCDCFHFDQVLLHDTSTPNSWVFALHNPVDKLALIMYIHFG